MKKSGYILVFIFMLPLISFSQPLGQSRMDRLKQSVVRIVIDGEAVGTGFFVSLDGLVLTNWHVIQSSLKIDSVSISISKKISVELASGEVVDVKGFVNAIFNEGFLEANLYDYCIMTLVAMPKQKILPLNLSSFNNISEGDLVITCGYPFGMKQQFISSGMLSTKFTEPISIKLNSGKDTIFNRSAAWLDLTMNKGNSGGPVIKLGNTPAEDVVIGIATFIQSPFSRKAENFYRQSKESGWDIRSGNFSQTDANQLFALSTVYSSYGISGCVDISHFFSFAQKYLMTPPK